MRSINLKNRDGFLNLLTLIIAVAIIGTLYYTKFLHYNEPVIDKETRETMLQVGIDTSSYHSTVESTLKEIDKIEQSLQNREEELLDKLNRY